MRHIKIFRLTIMASLALGVIGVGASSATELYGSAGTLGVGTTLDFSLESGTAAKLTETGGGTLDECTGSTMQAKITNAGSSTTTVTSETTALTWSGCTFPTSTVALGKLEAHHISGTTNGTVTADAEISVTINTVFFGSCLYGVSSGTDLGLITPSKTTIVEAKHVLDWPKFHADATAVKRPGSAFACPETARWAASSAVTQPSGSFSVEAS